MIEPTWRTFSVSGADARSYLQGQLTQDLADGDAPRWSLLLQPDSIVIATAYVELGETVFVSVPAGVAEQAMVRLRRFVLRADVQFEERDPHVVPRSLDELYALPWPHDDELTQGLLPHSYGAAVIGATVSFSKGCYTGQELVGRLDARGGNTPWRLARSPILSSLEDVVSWFGAGPDGPKGLTRHREVLTPEGPRFQGLGIAHRSQVASA